MSVPEKKDRPEMSQEERRAYGKEMGRREKAGLVVKGDTFAIKDLAREHNATQDHWAGMVKFDGRDPNSPRYTFPDEQLLMQMTEGLSCKKMRGYYLVMDPDKRGARSEPTPLGPCASCGKPESKRRLPDHTGAMAPVCVVCALIPQEMRDYGA